jgi:glycosyltransferase involved in cell wall biosynthesis
MITMKITLCLLTRNERPCLEVIFPQIPQPGKNAGFDQIVAIDGGSTDGTLEFFKSHGIAVIGQSKKGRGDAFQQAFEKIESDAYIFLSPDGNESVSDLFKFRKELEQGADLVIASRMMKGARNEEDDLIFPFRKWANLVFNFLANLTFRRRGPFVTDSINGLRAITKEAANKLKLDAIDFTIEYQMTMRALKNKLKIVEFPTMEGKRVAGVSGAPSIPTGLRFIRAYFKELLH